VRPAAHRQPLPVDHAGAPADTGTHAAGSVTAVSDDDPHAARPVVRTVVPAPAARPTHVVATVSQPVADGPDDAQPKTTAADPARARHHTAERAAAVAGTRLSGVGEVHLPSHAASGVSPDR
jgi:hypothetical protein